MAKAIPVRIGSRPNMPIPIIGTNIPAATGISPVL